MMIFDFMILGFVPVKVVNFCLDNEPCREFVNNVWYIKILSLEDVQKMGEEQVKPFSPTPG